MTSAQAAGRTGHVTQQFVIPMWTLTPTITQMVISYTHAGSLALVQTKAGHVMFAVLLVLAVNTVREPIAFGVDGKTVQPLCCTAVMTVRTSIIHFHSLLREVARAIQVDINASPLLVISIGFTVGAFTGLAADFVRIVCTVRELIAALAV